MKIVPSKPCPDSHEAETARFPRHVTRRPDADCQQYSAGLPVGSVKPQTQDKAIALELILQQYYPHLKLEQIITIGDSPNDESLFQQKFPFSVGVANILDYRDRLQHLPVYVTQASEARGFIELAELVMNTNKLS